MLVFREMPETGITVVVFLSGAGVGVELRVGVGEYSVLRCTGPP